MRVSQDARCHGPLLEMYQDVLSSLASSKTTRNLDLLWARLAPSGNIYRYLALRAEQQRNSEDLQSQLRALAARHAELLGGEGLSLEKRAGRLLKLLGGSVQRNVGLSPAEEGREVRGFAPVEEFVSAEGSFAGEVSRKDYLMASLVCCIQVVAPVLILLHNWRKEENELRAPGKVLAALSLQEAVCFGQSLTGALTTVMGTMLLVVVNTIILNYACGEEVNARKLGPIPMQPFWCGCSTLANATCCLVISLTIPLEFWSEEGPTGLIMNAMALLFIFTFDDLSSDAFSYLDRDDASFQREVAWSFALLTHCPVALSDLVDPDAQSAAELWRIDHDAVGNLLTVAGSRCDTRLSLPAGDETTPLAAWEVFPEVRYQVTPGGAVRNLPGWRQGLCKLTWLGVVAMLHGIWWVVPVVWFVVNKPCRDAMQQH